MCFNESGILTNTFKRGILCAESRFAGLKLYSPGLMDRRSAGHKCFYNSEWSLQAASPAEEEMIPEKRFIMISSGFRFS
jgi:hypothetical protein